MEDKDDQDKPPKSREELFKEVTALTCSAGTRVEESLRGDHFSTRSVIDILRASGFEEYFKELMANPNVDGWLRLCEVLKEAKEDKRIASSPGASGFLGLMMNLAGDAITASTADEAIKPLAKAIKSSQTSEMAIERWSKEKNAREWIISEWLKYKNDYEGNKSAFARDYVKRVLHERDVKITERNIRERWLKDL